MFAHLKLEWRTNKRIERPEYFKNDAFAQVDEKMPWSPLYVEGKEEIWPLVLYKFYCQHGLYRSQGLIIF